MAAEARALAWAPATWRSKASHKMKEMWGYKWTRIVIGVVGLVVATGVLAFLIDQNVVYNECSIPSYKDHGRTDMTAGGRVGSMLTVECEEGYWFTGTSQRTCQADGQWSGLPGFCKEVHCSRITDPPNAQILYFGYRYQAIAEVICDDLYLFSNPGNNKLTCLGNNSWSTFIGDCEIGLCGKLRIPEYGKMQITSDDMVTFSCQEGFTYEGNQNLICQGNGFFNGKALDCPHILEVPDFQIMEYHGTAEMKCYEGSIALHPHENKLTSQADNTRSTMVGTCKVVECPYLPPQPHGWIEYSGIRYLDTAVVRCKEGYNFSQPDQNKQTCQGNNKWSAAVGECQEIHCESILQIENGKTSSILYSRYRDRITLICYPGYYVDGSDEITCQANGRWNTKNGKCTIDMGVHLRQLAVSLILGTILAQLLFLIWFKKSLIGILVHAVVILTAPAVHYIRGPEKGPSGHPCPPQELTGTVFSGTSILLSWEEPEDDGGCAITDYIIERCEDDKQQYPMVSVQNELQYQVDDLQPGTSFMFRVAALNKVGTSKYINLQQALTTHSHACPPQELTDDGGCAITDYIIERWEDEELQYTMVSEQNELQYQVDDLQPGNSYMFRHKVGASKYYNLRQALTTHSIPCPPQELTGTIVSGTSISLRWEEPEDDGCCAITDYIIERCEGDQQQYTMVPEQNELQHQVDDLQPGTSYMFRVAARNKVGTSKYINLQQALRTHSHPCPPQKLSGTVVSGTSVSLRWEEPEDDGGCAITYYIIEGCEGNQQHYTMVSEENELQHQVDGLQPGTSYKFRVAARNKVGTSEYLYLQQALRTQNDAVNFLYLRGHMVFCSIFSGWRFCKSLIENPKQSDSHRSTPATMRGQGDGSEKPKIESPDYDMAYNDGYVVPDVDGD